MVGIPLKAIVEQVCVKGSYLHKIKDKGKNETNGPRTLNVDLCVEDKEQTWAARWVECVLFRCSGFSFTGLVDA